MLQSQLSNLLVDQSKDHIWMVDSNLQLVYANQSYLKLTKEMTGEETKLNTSILVEGLGEGYIEKWKAYYDRALGGEYFEIEEHYFHPASNEIYYGQIIFEPLTGEDGKISTVACQSRNITRIVKQKSEANQLMDASLDVFCTVNERGIFMYVSAASINLWGYLPEELIGKSYQDLILEEDLPKTNETVTSILSGQDIKSFTNRYRKKNGEIAYNLWSARWDKRTKLRYAVARDGKEKIVQEEKIQQSEQRFKALVQEGSDLIGILDAEGKYEYVSPTSMSILGIAPEEFLGRNAFEFIHPDDVARTLASLQEISTENIVMVKPFRFQNSKQEWRWIETVLTNMLDNPAVHGIVANSRDITDKIEENHKLKLLESVIINTKDCVLITEAEPLDEPGPKILFVNEAFTKMTGYTAAEVIGKTPRILQGPNSDKKELARLSRAIRNWESCEITTINYDKAGREFWVNFTVTPVGDNQGLFTHWISVQRDVTEQKTKELENELLAQISVNFNTENDYVRASHELCKSISKFGKFDWVELWTANLEKSQIQLLSHYVATPEDEKFYDYSQEVRTFRMFESLAGKVWAERVEFLWDDIENNKNFVRKEAAKMIGLKAVLGIPLIFGDEVVGILKIGTKQDASYLKNYVATFKRMERFIGSELNRKKLENDLGHLFNTIPDILCLTNLEGKFLKINRAACELLGYSEAEILTHKFYDYVLPEDKDTTSAEAMRLARGESSSGFESRYLTKDGRIIWLSWYCNAIMEEGIVYATAKNITEEKKLRELNRNVSHLAKIGSWEVDLVENKLFWSDEVHQMYETDPQLIVPNLNEFVNSFREDFQALAKSNLQKCIEIGISFDFEAVLITAKKKERWVRSFGNAEFVGGECRYVYGGFQDIHERKDSENRLISLSENIPGVIYQYIIHPDGTDSMQHVSGNVEQVWGYTRDEVMESITPLWDEINLGGDIEEVKSSLLKAIETKSRWRCRYRIVLPTGELKTHIGTGTPIFLADGSVLFNVITLDITQETKNEALLKQASEISRIGSWELDLLKPENENMYWSPMVKEILEVKDSYEPTLKDTIEFYVGESKDRKQRGMNLVIKEGIEFDEELLVRTAKGKDKWIRCIGKSETVNHKRTRIYGSFQDIDERKKSEINLAESENRFRTILEAEPECIKLLNPDGELLMMNPAGLAMIEAESEEQVLGKSMLEVLLPEYRSAFSKLTENIFKGESGKLEFEIEGFKGTRRWLETHAVPLKNEKGKIISLLGVTRDITERKSAEEGILRANERFEKVTEATNDAIWDWDLEHQIIYRSKAFERFFGKTPSQSSALKDFWKNNFHPEDVDINEKSIYEAMANPACTRWELEYRVFNEKRKILYVTDRGVIIRNKEGKAIRMVGAMTDISEYKRLSVQLSDLNESLQKYTVELERSNEELEQFAYVASHDLQEPLRMITSFMDQLKRKYADQLDEKAHQYIHFATDGAKRMKQIILNVLEYSRASRQTEGKEEVDMNEILSEFKQLRRKLISEKNAVIKSANLPTLHTYNSAVTQIINCLLDNAIKYTEEGINPVVEIKVVENKKEWTFSIKDNGIGIDSQFYDKIFIIFQRLHNKDQYNGTGIGLSIAKKHVEYLGGRIWLESVLGEGTVFYFTIPKNN